MNSTGLFSFFLHKSEIRPAIRSIFHTLFGPDSGAKNAKLLKKMPD